MDGAERRPRDRALGIGGQTRDPEVRDHRPAVARQQDVAGLHVAVDDAPDVGDAERARDVETDPGRLRRRQAPAPAQTSRQVFALDQLHDQERLAVVRAGLQAGDDVGVAQHGGGQRLPPEAHRDVAVLDRLAPQELDRHGPVELRVQRAMDGGHAAEADDLAEAVAAVDQPADVRGGVRGLVRLGHRATIAEVPKMSARCAADALVKPTMQVERGRPPDAGARRRTSCR